MTKYSFRIESQVGIRLDQFLVKKFPQYSRAYLKKQIRAGNILVNGKIVKPAYLLKENDKIEIKIPKIPELKILPNPEIKIKIIYEDNDVIVIEKPAGIAVHPRQTKTGAPLINELNSTLVSGLIALYPLLANVGDNPKIRPGIVHRLDKDTSGLMVVAKNNFAFDWLKKQFKERKVIKEYLALVVGKLKEKRGIITKSISRAKDFRKRTTLLSRITPNILRGFSQKKEAETYYKTIKEFKDYTLIKAKPKTGRTHQIRVHLASIGHPIAGDKLYGFKRQKKPMGLERQFLHASYLKFSTPNGKILEFKSKLPKDLKEVVLTLSKFIP